MTTLLKLSITDSGGEDLMLKWTLGHKLPTPGPLGAAEGPKRQSDGDDNLHFAKRRRSTGAVRKASVRALRRRFEENKENEHQGVCIKC